MTFEEAVKEMEAIIGRPAAKREIETMVHLHDNYDISFDSTNCIIENCYALNKRNIRYIEQYAINLYELGIKTVDEINTHFAERKNNGLQIEISKSMGRKLFERDMEYIEKWKGNGHSDALILEAINRAVVATGQTGMSTIPYADRILEVWERESVDTLEKVSDFESRITEKRKASSSYKKQPMSGNVPLISVPARPDKNMIRFDVAELKTCPFCGDEKIGVKCQYSSKYDSFYFVVECNCCGANTRSIANNEGGSPDEDQFWKSTAVDQVVTLWNNRV